MELGLSVGTLRELYSQLEKIIDRKDCSFLDYPLILEKEGNKLVDLRMVMYKEEDCMLVVFKECKW